MKSPLKTKAERFLVWREGQAVNWECSLAELSAATGLPYATVQHNCKSLGRLPTKDFQNPDAMVTGEQWFYETPVDTMMQHPGMKSSHFRLEFHGD